MKKTLIGIARVIVAVTYVIYAWGMPYLAMRSGLITDWMIWQGVSFTALFLVLVGVFRLYYRGPISVSETILPRAFTIPPYTYCIGAASAILAMVSFSGMAIESTWFYSLMKSDRIVRILYCSSYYRCDFGGGSFALGGAINAIVASVLLLYRFRAKK